MSSDQRALEVHGTVQDLVGQLQTPEACAAFYVEYEKAFELVGIVWKHAKDMIMLAGREGKPIDAGAGALVLVEPSGYDVNQDVVKELAPEAIKTVEQPQPEHIKRIHLVAGELLELLVAWEDVDADHMEQLAREIVLLTQPQKLEAVDGRKLQGILGRGDQRAQELIDRKVKVANKWRIAVRQPTGSTL
jgi:hypothetical protein